MDTELRAVALMNLGIVETWSGQFADAERHVTEGATLAQAIGRPYLEVACRAYQAFPSTHVSLASARERGRHAVALAERYGLSDRPVLAPALGALASIAVWIGEFEEGERWLRRGWEVVQADIDPAVAVLLHMVTGMLHAGRGEASIGTRGVNRGGAGAVASHRCAHSRTGDRRMARSSRDARRSARHARRVLHRTRMDGRH